MASVVSQLMKVVTAHAQSDSLEDAREICADGSYFLNNPPIYILLITEYNGDIALENYHVEMH
jgi:hypothetical protein